MFAHLETLLLSYAERLPLEVFAVVASFVEEVIAPIPSPIVMIVTGSLAAIQEYSLLFLVLLSVLGMIGKLGGALVVYTIVDKAEDFVGDKIERFFGVTHAEIESFGARLGKGWRDYVLLTILRALPIIPSSLISVGCGVLKVRMKLFVVSTAIGTIIRDFVYLYFGYTGAEVLGSFINKSATIESMLEIVALVVIAAGLGFLFYRRMNKKNT